MIAELFINNAFNLTVILSCCAALVLMSVWYHRGERRCKGFIFHAAQFLVYAIIIGTLGSIANNVIENYSLRGRLYLHLVDCADPYHQTFSGN